MSDRGDSNATYAKNLLLHAAQRARNAGDAAEGAIEELEGMLPPGRPQFTYPMNGPPRVEPPWTLELHRLAGTLTNMRSARSRARKIAEELERYAEAASRHA
jgi:hypothetical protein